MEEENVVFIRDYRVLSVLGEGGMGKVFLAEEALLERQIAIKRLNPLLTNDPQFSERFINEARIQAKLIHPNIVALYNFFVQDGVYYMAMEYAEGRTLRDVIATTGPIPEQRTIKILRQIIEALSYAHSKAIIHRDIKPSNIVLDADDNVKVMDFGIARILDERHLTRTGTKLGTLYYMSPEQVRAERDIDIRTDIYSAGIVLFEMLTGRLPFNTDTDSDYVIMDEIVKAALPNPRTIYPHISDKAISLLNKATHKDKNMRYLNCQNVLDDCKYEKTGAMPSSVPKSSTAKESIPKNPSNSPLKSILGAMEFVEEGSLNILNSVSNGLEHFGQVRAFLIGQYPVTQKEWYDVMGINPSFFSNKQTNPIEQISWFEAIEFCNRLSLLHGVHPCYELEGYGFNPSNWKVLVNSTNELPDCINCDWEKDGFRLPTEMEWMFAATGGRRNSRYIYSGSDNIDEVAWHWYNSSKQTNPVGQKISNSIGTHDMSGNVWEWCWDSGLFITNQNAGTNAAFQSKYRVIKGGSWKSIAGNCSVSNRAMEIASTKSSDIGFRIARTAK